MKRATLVLLSFLVASAAAAHEAPQLTTVILVRHAEKVTDPAIKDPDLTAEGTARAQRLASLLSRAGITTVYTTPYARTRQTAAPVATALKLTALEPPVSRTYAEELAAVVKKENGGTILVVGHSNTTQDVMKALGIADAPKIEESEYDNLFVVTLAPGLGARMVRLRY